MKPKIVTHRDLEVYQHTFGAAMQIFELSKAFPKEETYALADQIRRSSRSVCANIAEAWRKRRYEKHSLASFLMPKGKQLKHKPGSSLQLSADISIGTRV